MARFIAISERAIRRAPVKQSNCVLTGATRVNIDMGLDKRRISKHDRKIKGDTASMGTDDYPANERYHPALRSYPALGIFFMLSGVRWIFSSYAT